MKTQKLAIAAVVITCLGAALPALNWAQENQERDVENALRDKVMAQRHAAEAQKAAAKAMAKATANPMAKAAAHVKQVEDARFNQSPFADWTGPPGSIFVAGSKGVQRHLTQIQEAAEYYCDAKEGAEKDKALKRLHDLASKYFEEDMEIRKKELADIEARLAKLRSQLDRRRAKKDEIVDLQMKVAINEAEGLGFTSAPRNDFKFDVRVAAPVMAPLQTPKFAVPDPLSSDLFHPPVRVEAPLPPMPPTESLQTLSYGAKGDAVRLLQETLNEKLDPSPELAVDGDFGPETDRAVKTFQSRNDLEETGVVDDATREKLELPADLPPFVYN